MPFCFNCGAQVNTDAPFCEQCGKPNASYEPPVQQSVPMQQSVQQNIPAQQPIQQSVQQSVPMQQPVQQNIPMQQPVQQSVPMQQPVQQSVPMQQPVQPQYMPQYPQYSTYMQGVAVKKSKAPIIIAIVIVVILGIAAAIVVPIILNNSGSGTSYNPGSNTSYSPGGGSSYGSGGNYGYNSGSTNSRPYIGAWADSTQSMEEFIAFGSDGVCLSGDSTDYYTAYYEEVRNNILIIYNDKQHTDYTASIKYSVSGNKISLTGGSSNTDGTNFVSSQTISCYAINFSNSPIDGIWLCEEYPEYPVIISGNTISLAGETIVVSISDNQISGNGCSYIYTISGDMLIMTDVEHDEFYYFTKLY